MKAYNFSSLEKREAKLYSISDVNISAKGIPYMAIGLATGCLAISLVVHYFIGQIIGVNYMSPVNFSKMEPNNIQIIFIWILPIVFGASLYYIEIQNFKLFQFLLLLIIPRRTLNAQGKAFRRSKVTFNAFLENQH